MHVIAIIIALVGFIGGIMKISGVSTMVRPVDEISAVIWFGIAAAGAVLWVITRRPSD